MIGEFHRLGGHNFAGKTRTCICCCTSFPLEKLGIASVAGHPISLRKLPASDYAASPHGYAKRRGASGCRHQVCLRVGVSLRPLALVLEVPLHTPMWEPYPPAPLASSRNLLRPSPFPALPSDSIFPSHEGFLLPSL